MSELSRHHEDERVERAHTVANSGPAFRHVMACVDTSAHARKVIPHAVAIAKAMEATLTLVRVLEPGPTGEGPPDPVEWDIRRHQARDLCVPKIRFCNIGGEGHRELVVI
jgi:Universal stress protein family